MKELIIVLLIFILSFIVLFLFWRFPFFLRNPKRKIPYDEKAILAPADGYVVYCKKIKPGNDIISIKKDISIKLDDLMLIDDKELQNQPGWHIGIFMTIFDVHYNRTPIRGHIKKLRHDFPTKNKENSLHDLY